MHASAWQAIDEQVARFTRRHGRCGGLDVDVPALPSGDGRRLLLACRCGDTLEQPLPALLAAGAHTRLLERVRRAAA
ncbi:MAG TPA: hypothetical protein VNN07_09825 [Candidatus Tectomicrobia bacterium]|nr:hypothetical protein [Candidatus Tectomicrobia bacterium]